MKYVFCSIMGILYYLLTTAFPVLGILVGALAIGYVTADIIDHF